MKLFIDSRENSKLGDMVTVQANKMGILNEKKWLEVGDYVIGNVCFEAKSAVDFLQSVVSKRIWTQIDNMDKWYDRNFVVIYGSLEDALSSMKYITNMNQNINPKQLKVTYTNRFKGAIGRLRLD